MEKIITDSQYLNIMNFFSTPELEKKRLDAICHRFNVKFVKYLPRDKYKEAIIYLKSGEWMNNANT